MREKRLRIKVPATNFSLLTLSLLYSVSRKCLFFYDVTKITTSKAGQRIPVSRTSSPRPMMSNTKCRRITLLDLMVLTAATAIGLSLIQFGWPGKGPVARVFTWPVWSGKGSGYVSKMWMIPIAERVAPLIPCLAAWTGAYLVTRLRSPRPQRRRLVFQPGFVAAVAALSVLAIESILLVGSAKIDGRFGWASSERVADFVANGIVLLAHHVGWAVAVAWLTLIIIGRWRPERSWVDRWGRVLGCAWIIVGPLASLLLDHATWWGDFFN